jgi:hypothetical protein
VVWLHILDHDVLELFKLRQYFSSEQLISLLRGLTSIACLFAKNFVAMPAAGFIETELSAPILEWHAPFAEAGIIRTTGNALHAFEYFEKRKAIMKAWPERQSLVARVSQDTLRRIGSIWAQKPSGTTTYLIDGWRKEATDPHGIWRRQYSQRQVQFTDGIVNALLAVPERLSESAFTAKLALQVTEIPELSRLHDTANLILSRQWTVANAALLGAAVMSQIPLLNVDALLGHGTPTLPVASVLQIMRSLGIWDEVRALPAERLLLLSMHPDWRLFATTSWRLAQCTQYTPEIQRCIDRTCSLVRGHARGNIPEVCAAFEEFFIQLGGPQILSAVEGEEPPSVPVAQVTNITQTAQRERKMAIKIFISHSSHDRDLAATLVEVLMAAFDTAPEEIRCTSVPGFALPAGSRTSDTLRNDIVECDVVVGLVSERSVSSSYVLFELGAAWGLGKQTFPLVLKGFDFSSLPGPLNETHALRLTGISEVNQFVEDIGRIARLPKGRVNAARLAHKITQLVALANA